ncbi:hypothetical protein JCM19294_2907 [Nonlabens tegetincola]|uniref:Uncharacterized protein n=1 Tax=Nonlabens tegetincola TaxID=323273 RepID=A0A090PZE1_9FLAO|nr:hypothetical protein JCM19294_2907 [Nonlabens tegetincola]
MIVVVTLSRKRKLIYNLVSSSSRIIYKRLIFLRNLLQ